MVAVLVVLTILACVTIDAAIQWAHARRRRLELATWAAQPAGPFKALTMEAISLPFGIFLDPSHTWIKVGIDGRAKIGVDDFLSKVIGRIDEIIMPKVGTHVNRGETLFSLRQGSRKMEIPAPVDGTITSQNESVNADLIHTDPYEQGWVVGMRTEHLAKNLKRFSIAEDAMMWIKGEVRRFQDFITSRPFEQMELGHVMQDGGVVTAGVLELMDDETWNRFSSEFVLAAKE